MCSKFKILAAATVFSQVDTGVDTLERRIDYEAMDIVVNSAITKDRTGGYGMSVNEIAQQR